MTPEKRQRFLLAVLGLCLLAAAWVYLPPLLSLPEAEPAAAAPGPAARRPRVSRGEAARAARSAAEVEEVVELRLAALAVEPFEFRVGRDLFRFAPPPPPPAPPPPSAAELAALERARVEAAERARLAALEAAKPRPPAVDLVYLGSFGPAATRVAVFGDKGQEQVLNARVGEVIKGKFILEEIGLESVSLKFVGFPDVAPQRLAIGG